MASGHKMHVDRLSLALTRIETAAHRIKRVAQPGQGSANADLELRYAALRREASSVLADLDELIARLEP